MRGINDLELNHLFATAEKALFAKIFFPERSVGKPQSTKRIALELFNLGITDNSSLENVKQAYIKNACRFFLAHQVELTAELEERISKEAEIVMEYFDKIQPYLRSAVIENRDQEYAQSVENDRKKQLENAKTQSESTDEAKPTIEELRALRIAALENKK